MYLSYFLNHRNYYHQRRSIRQTNKPKLNNILLQLKRTLESKKKKKIGWMIHHLFSNFSLASITGGWGGNGHMTQLSPVTHGGGHWGFSEMFGYFGWIHGYRGCPPYPPFSPCKCRSDFLNGRQPSCDEEEKTRRIAKIVTLTSMSCWTCQGTHLQESCYVRKVTHHLPKPQWVGFSVTHSHLHL